jgi:hypothetical protein
LFASFALKQVSVASVVGVGPPLTLLPISGLEHLRSSLTLVFLTRNLGHKDEDEKSKEEPDSLLEEKEQERKESPNEKKSKKEKKKKGNGKRMQMKCKGKGMQMKCKHAGSADDNDAAEHLFVLFSIKHRTTTLIAAA